MQKFEEEHTGIVVSMPSVSNSCRNALQEQHRLLYLALRAEHGKRKTQQKQREKEARLAQQVPKTIGEMTVKGRNAKGELRYSWSAVGAAGAAGGQTFEVAAENAESALRKMVRKVKDCAAKVCRGEAQRLVATAPPASRNAGAEALAGALPALAQLEDRAILHHLREA